MGGKLENWKLENWWDLEFESTIEAEYTKTVLSRTRVKARRAYVAISVIAVVIVLIKSSIPTWRRMIWADLSAQVSVE